MKTKVELTRALSTEKRVKENLIGRVFGKLTVLNRDFDQIGKKRGTYWICQCECGKICSTSRHSMVNHGAKSCGCLQKEVAISRAIPNAGSDKKSWLNKYKRRCQKKGTEFSLTDKQFYDICSMNCYYCDALPSPRSCGYKTKKDVGEYRANGIDRVDPNVGYIETNCVPCCTICNFMKTNKSQKDFINKILEIADHIGRSEDV